MESVLLALAQVVLPSEILALFEIVDITGAFPKAEGIKDLIGTLRSKSTVYNRKLVVWVKGVVPMAKYSMPPDL